MPGIAVMSPPTTLSVKSSFFCRPEKNLLSFFSLHKLGVVLGVYVWLSRRACILCGPYSATPRQKLITGLLILDILGVMHVCQDIDLDLILLLKRKKQF